ncbi:hybrid sensor histidine kinase/response regulator [Saccharophagus sp. K07]|uniref:ATP-binding response regulator n=1 Tax=Saccharophagus sp. K07 TaxID=2283636 RepID=UPI001652813A|nr:hybrid sensor histidine kinase/response regulator [Saccharophagus sp. K07]MBC6904340.1 hybrid sensor histidine kinase/response regulator [Saccharophagus sp. K07]
MAAQQGVIYWLKSGITRWWLTAFVCAWLLALIVLLCTLLIQNNVAQGRENRLKLTYYANAVTSHLTQQGANDVGAEFLRLLNVPGLRLTCIYIDQSLHIASGLKGEAPCPQHPNEQWGSHAELTVILPFTTREGQAGQMILRADDQRPPLLPLLTTLIVLILSFIASAILLSRNYLRRQQEFLQAQPLRELKELCNTLYQTQNYRLRAKEYGKSPYGIIARMINQMLEELQTNENELQEYAVQIQEKNDQLASQKRLHQDLNQNLQKMFAGASHDLRQPLQAMMIFVGAIKEHATAKQEPLIQKLEQVVDNLNHLFTDLLDISKLESRMTRVPKQNVELRPLLTKIYDEFEALAGEKRIELRLYNRDLTVFSNPNMLERIIRNMISNAIRYTRTGGVLIGSRKRNNAVWIEVWDTGRGIPQEKIGEIFNEFVQIKDEENDNNKGVGLGLFIVKRLAQLLDHSIIVTSKLRRGTMFRIVAPSHATSVTQTESPALPPAPVISTPQLIQNKLALKILLLDDDDDVRQALTQLLQGWGCQVSDWARLDDLQTALANESAYDLMISDFQLDTDMDGLQAIAQVRQQLARPLPALVITATQDPELLTRIDNSGIPSLRKPVRPAKLRALLQALTTPQEN